METRLEDMISEVQNLTNTQLDMMNLLMLSHQELNRKVVTIENLRSRKDLLNIELKLRKNLSKDSTSLMKQSNTLSNY